jgi:capsid portal protein
MITKLNRNSFKKFDYIKYFKGGQHISLYVTVSDGQLTAKSEVYINIENAIGIKTGETR